MSEKNGQQRGTQQQQQWPTATAGASTAGDPATEAGKAKLTHIAQPYHLTSALPPGAALYGSTLTMADLAAHHVQQQHGQQQSHTTNSGYARFQPPPIQHYQPPPTHLSHTCATLTASSSSNVPVFVPPPFSVATPTSLVTSTHRFATVGAPAGNNTFGLEHFQHSGNVPQMQLSTFVAAGSLPVSASPATALSLTFTGTTPAPQDTPSPNSRQPEILPSSVCGSETTTAGSSVGGAISAALAESVLNVIGAAGAPSANASSVTAAHGRLLGIGVTKTPDEDKMRRIQGVIEAAVGEHSKQQMLQILDRIALLKPVEKLLLYLRLPSDAPETDPLRHPQNPLGTRSEINHTINWVRSHLEHDPQVSIPKQDVYNDYIAYCERLDIKPLSTADFGKVMKQVFPGIRPRRLGTRGHSRYCYAAMRKTTKLPAPQLPALSLSADNSGAKTDVSSQSGTSETGAVPHVIDTDTWETVKSWAETLLNVRVDSMCELAARIRAANNQQGAGSLSAGSSAALKKQVPREPKEKRLQTDMGPLKKRRKKKRKGSSSSESSAPPQQQQTTSGTLDQSSNCSAVAVKTEEQKPNRIIKVKQELLDSPNYAHAQQMSLTVQPLNATLGESAYGEPQVEQPTQQQQQMPMNLATEQRQAAAATSPSVCTAVKNLTPKILEMSDDRGAASVSCVESMPSIKEEIVDEYNPSNIFCKKVRKAQQTKGFWTNSPTPPTHSATASSPPMATTVITASSNVAATLPVSNYAMGPPAQLNSAHSNTLAANATTSQDASGPSVATPKVASRNWLQLRAKKLQQAAALAAAAEGAGSTADLGGVNKDADLPDNLGLPRERVISICNMDKHELDDYFLPGEEENSQDQDTELLQYFQTGDAEEKLNSLDANKHRTPTVANTDSATLAPSQSAPVTSGGGETVAKLPSSLLAALPLPGAVDSSSATFLALNCDNTATAAVTATAMRPSTPQTAVGSASASLALMSQKHQQLQQQHQAQQQLQPQQQPPTSSGNKRKISFDFDAQRTAPARKNFIFLPISPNSSGSNNNNGGNQNVAAGNGRGAASAGDAPSTNQSCFASPGLAIRLRPKPAFSKQQSLDCVVEGGGERRRRSYAADAMLAGGKRLSLHAENSDPMLCMERREYAKITSASAPPSPSLLQEQQRSFYFGNGGVTNGNQWPLSNGSYNANNNNNGSQGANDGGMAALLNEQNSLDLDLLCYQPPHAYAIETADDCALVPLSEMQRSQSVPLSQLQRTHSPTFNRAGLHAHVTATAHYSACASVAQTPVPPDYAVFSENSNSQQSIAGNSNNNNNNTGQSIKLAETGVLNSDSTAMLDDVDVILSSSDFVSKFSSLAGTGNAATTCSSSGSSSGYSSAGPIGSIFSGAGGVMSASVGGGIVSRSVPSTPLPHHQQSLFGNVSGGYVRRRINDEVPLSPLGATATGGAVSMTHGFRLAGSKYGQPHSNSSGQRTVYDISKSMPTTPITTPCFRYSPTEFNRDFLINGNTIDSLISSSGGGGPGTSGDIIGLGQLNADTLISDADCVGYSAAANADAETIMVGADLLGNL